MIKIQMALWVLPVLWGVACVRGMDPTTKDLVTPIRQYGEGCGYETCRAVREGFLTVHLVPHSHAELGYTRTFDDHYTGNDEFYDKSNINMKRILDATISELWANRERTFMISSSEMPYFFHWWARRDGTVHRMVYQLLREGRLSLAGGGWGMADEASTSYIGIIDQFTYTLRKLNASFLDCGRPLVAWQADCFGHSREVAALLAQMGFDGLFINPISFDDELARMRDKSLEFLWRGSDDLGRETDLFTHKLFDGYWSPPGFCFGSMCGDPVFITSDSLFNNVDQRVQLFLEHMQQRQAPHYRSQHILVMMGQRLGYHDAQLWFENIDKLISFVNQKGYQSPSKVHVQYSTPACYLRALHDSNPVVPTKQDDFFPFAYDQFTCATGMYTSRPPLKYMVREAQVYLQMAKQLQVLARLGNNDQLFEDFNWIMGVSQDHNVLSGAMRDYVASYYSRKIYDAVQASTVLLRQAFNKLRGSKTRVYYRCSFNESSCNVFVSHRSEIVIYNPLAWPVSRPVRLPVLRGRYVVYDHRGEVVNIAVMKIPSPVIKLPERNTAADHELVFIALDLPPLGLRSYLIEREIRRRVKKELIKKLKKKKQGTYYIRQANPYPLENASLFSNEEDYVYYDDVTTERVGNIQVGNIPDENTRDKDSDPILTPKPRTENPVTDKESENMNVTTTTDVTYKKTTENYGFVADRKLIDDNFKDYEMFTEGTVSRPTRTTTTKHVDVTTPAVTDIYKDFLNVVPTTETPTFEKFDEKITETETYKSEGADEEIAKDFRKSMHNYEESNDYYIENKYIKIIIDNTTNKVASVVLSNGVNTSLDIQFYYYVSDDPVKMNTPEKRPPGAYIFRAMDINPEPIIDYVDTKVYKSDIVNEIHCKYSDYASFALKLYKDSPVIEVDWVAGPISVSDELGKDVFIRYMTDLVNDGVFYTDANGRQTIKRIRHMRASYDPIKLDPIAGNIYPVTARIYIEDLSKNIRLSIFNDRSQGGTSLYDGMVDLMVHRRILTDDSGIQSYLNETINGQGITVRGTHYLYLTKADFKPNKVFEKKFAKEIELMPQIFANGMNVPEKKKWLEMKNEVFALKSKLPTGVHILTLEDWNDGTILLRLENYLEKVDVVKHGVKKVYLKDLFKNIKVKKVKETTLAANIWLENWTPLQWNISKPFVKRFNDYYGDVDKVEYSKDEDLKPVEEVVLDDGITLTPQQIRTFVVWFTYQGD